jgi:hypothetical protein
MTDVAGRRPFGEADLDDQRGLDEPDPLRDTAGAEGTVGARLGLEPGFELGDDRGGETTTDLAGIVQDLALVVADEQRTDTARAALLAGLPAADDKFLSQMVLDLDPRARATPGFVPRVDPLGDDPFEPELFADLERRAAVAFLVRRCLPRQAVEVELAQTRPAVGVGQIEQRVAVEPEGVEQHVRDGHLADQSADH